MPDVTCVGAFIRDGGARVYVHRRAPGRRLLPGIWDVVGGHLEPGETPEQALARELAEETGWTLRRIEASLADWEWEHQGVRRRERDYLVEVDGDLGAPRLEEGKHDAYAWVGLPDLELMMEGRTDGDRRLRDLVAKVARIRLTDRLRLEPVGPEHAGDLYWLHHQPAVAAWHGGRYTVEGARGRTARGRRSWERAGVDRWMAYLRETGELVGRGGLSWTELDGRPVLEVGWTVRPDRWGQGYATEIGRAAFAFARESLGAPTVFAFTEPHNIRSLAVISRLGMGYVREVVRDGTRLALYARAQPYPPRA